MAVIEGKAAVSNWQMGAAGPAISNWQLAVSETRKPAIGSWQLALSKDNPETNPNLETNPNPRTNPNPSPVFICGRLRSSAAGNGGLL